MRVIRALLSEKIERTLASLVESGAIPTADFGIPEIADTKQPEHGDYACNIAMVASKKVGMNPRAFAEIIVAEISKDPDFAAVEIAGPGFINLRLNPAFLTNRVKAINANPLPKPTKPGKKINVEFVSVNPNGPITIGSGRGAAFGSTLCNILEAAGHEVHREYYINDGVNSEQMRQFAESVRSIVLDQPIPEKGYKGDYVYHVGERLIELNRNYRLALVRPLVFEIRRLSNGLHSGVMGMAKLVLPHVNPAERLEHLYHQVTEAEALEHAIDLVQELADEEGSDHHGLTLENIRDLVSTMPVEQLQSVVQEFMITKQREDLETFGVTFDTWFSEQSLHDAGIVAAKIDELSKGGVADDEAFRAKVKFGKKQEIVEVERETQAQDEDDAAGANPTLWLRSTKFGDDQDRVLRRRDGRLTYIASDVAYHADKFNRPANADQLMTVLGPDHHGYIGRLRAVIAAMLIANGTIPTQASEVVLTEEEAKLFSSPGDKVTSLAALEEAKKRLDVVIFQLVRFVKDGQPAPMRKRDGNIYAVIDLIHEIGQAVAPEADQQEQDRIGRDVSRFFYLMRSHETPMDFDLDLATRQSDENPVFYVQYAHARICAILRKAQDEHGWTVSESTDLSPLTNPREMELIKKIDDLPYEISRCAEDHGVHRIATYATDLARTYHHFYDACRVIQPDQPELSAARLLLCNATKQTLKAALSVMGISAPEAM